MKYNISFTHNESQVITIFRLKTGILVASWRFLGKMIDEWNHKYRIMNNELRGFVKLRRDKKKGDNKLKVQSVKLKVKT